MNKGKRGRAYEYPESFVIFMKILHDCIHIRGLLRALSKYIPKIKVKVANRSKEIRKQMEGKERMEKCCLC